MRFSWFRRIWFSFVKTRKKKNKTKYQVSVIKCKCQKSLPWCCIVISQLVYLSHKFCTLEAVATYQNERFRWPKHVIQMSNDCKTIGANLIKRQTALHYNYQINKRMNGLLEKSINYSISSFCCTNETAWFNQKLLLRWETLPRWHRCIQHTNSTH